MVRNQHVKYTTLNTPFTILTRVNGEKNGNLIGVQILIQYKYNLIEMPKKKHLGVSTSYNHQLSPEDRNIEL